MITTEFCCGISSQRNVSQIQLLFLAISLLSQWLIEINKIGLIFICSSNVILKSMILPYQHDESETSQTMTNEEVFQFLHDCINNDCIGHGGIATNSIMICITIIIINAIDVLKQLFKSCINNGTNHQNESLLCTKNITNCNFDIIMSIIYISCVQIVVNCIQTSAILSFGSFLYIVASSIMTDHKSCYKLKFRLSNHDVCGNDCQCNFFINLAILFCFLDIFSTSNLNKCIQVTFNTIWISFWCLVTHYIFNNNNSSNMTTKSYVVMSISLGDIIIAIFIGLTIVYSSSGKLQTTLDKIDSIYTYCTTFLLQSHNDSARVISQESDNLFINIDASDRKIEYSSDQHIISASGDTETDSMTINLEPHSMELLFVLYAIICVLILLIDHSTLQTTTYILILQFSCARNWMFDVLCSRQCAIKINWSLTIITIL